MVAEGVAEFGRRGEQPGLGREKPREVGGGESGGKDPQFAASQCRGMLGWPEAASSRTEQFVLTDPGAGGGGQQGDPARAEGAGAAALEGQQCPLRLQQIDILGVGVQHQAVVLARERGGVQGGGVGAGGAVTGDQVTGEQLDNLAVSAGDAGQPQRGPQLRGDGLGLGAKPILVGIAPAPQSQQHELVAAFGGVEVGESGQDELGAATKTGEGVGENRAEADAAGAGGEGAIQAERAIAVGDPGVAEISVRVMHFHATGGTDVGAELGPQAVGVGRGVGAGGEHDANAVGGVADGLPGGKQRLENMSGGGGAGAVIDGDGDVRGVGEPAAPAWPGGGVGLTGMKGGVVRERIVEVIDSLGDLERGEGGSRGQLEPVHLPGVGQLEGEGAIAIPGSPGEEASRGLGSASHGAAPPRDWR